MIRAAVLVGALACALAVGAVVPDGAGAPATTPAASVGQGPPSGPDDATCEVSGLHTSFLAAYEPDDAGTYLVDGVVVSDIDASCADAELTVVVFDSGGSALATGSRIVGSSPSLEVALAPRPAADAMARVQVDVRGGTVPVPAACGAFVADRRAFGTTGDDVLTGTSRRDLIYGLGGADAIAGGPNPDCIDAGAGADEVRGDAGDDVLVGHDGADLLDGGPGRDRLHGGPGDDLLRGGAGNDVLDGGDGTDHCEGGGGQDSFVGCETKS